jgi:hypothetical protein
MIKVKNEIMNEITVGAMNKLIECKLPAATSFRVMNIIKEFNPILKMVREAYNKIIEKYAEKDANGQMKFATNPDGSAIQGRVHIPQAVQADYMKEVQDLNAVEVTLNADPINPADLGATALIEPSVFMVLDWLFTTQDKK